MCVFGARYPACGVRPKQVPGIRYRVPGTRHLEPDTQAPDT